MIKPVVCRALYKIPIYRTEDSGEIALALFINRLK